VTYDLDTFLALPRVSGLALSPDGTRLVTSVATVAPDGTKFQSALWQLDPAGEAGPVRLTRSAKGEAGAAFLPDGSVVFTSARPDPDAKKGEDRDDRAALWLLPAAGGEARLLADPPAGVDGLAVARDSGAVVLGVGAFPGTATLDDDAGKQKARKEAGVTAQLFESYPIRFWDHYIGPRDRRLYRIAPPPDGAGDFPDGRVDLEPVLDGTEQHLDEVSFDVTPDGATVLTGWHTRTGATDLCTNLVAVGTASGERRTLADGDAVYWGVRCSPDGGSAVCVRETLGDPDHAEQVTLWLVDLATGEGRDLTPDLDRWPHSLAWSPDSSAVYFVADENGRAPAFRVDIAGGQVTRLCIAGAFSDLCPSPDGTTLYAIRNTMASPPQAVALDTTTADQEPRPIPTPGFPVAGGAGVSPVFEVPGRIEEMTATASDGTSIHSWLALPADASAGNPAPLVVWIHGGPLGSWNSWHWRWNPWLLVERGYAVLMPDPALSTGYGQSFVERGRGRWGDEPFTDLMAATDAAVARPDIDADRTAAMGGSFGGYMANWVAGHTDRFRCLVTHASLWALDQFHGTTDHAAWWEREFGDAYRETARYEAHSPLDREDHDPDARHPRRTGSPRPHQRGPAALGRPDAPRRRGEVPLLPRREPLDRQTPARPRLVRDRPRLARPPPPRQGVAAAGDLVTDDPVRLRREQVARWAGAARRAGWALFGLAVVAFVSGLVIGLSALVVVVTVASLALGSVLLLPAIIIGFGVTAAEREDRG
jgi:dipeptidyl aminopeptidase/acylaminoacyl peptidase